MAVLIGLSWLAAGLLGLTGDVDVYLQGNYVDQLDEGAPVAVGTIPIGRVTEVSLREGRPTARLQLDRQHTAGISADSRFSVESLNDWMPGNVGVRVYPPAQPGDAPQIKQGASVEAINHAFAPPHVPPKFFLLVGLGLVVLIVVGVLAVVLYRWVSALSTLIAVALGIAILLFGYLYFQNNITSPQPPWAAEEAAAANTAGLLP